MAVPTITAVTPATGKTGGRNIIVIAGTNFLTPSETQISGDGYTDTILVEFEGEAADYAEAASTTEVYAKVPIYKGPAAALPAALSIRVSNLGENGDIIPGEFATLIDGYSVDRPSMIKPNLSVQVATRAFIDFLNRHVMQNVILHTDYAYSDLPAMCSRLKASIPVLLLAGPDISKSRFHNNTEKEFSETGRQSDEKPMPVICDLMFRLLFIGNTLVHSTNFMTNIIALARDNREILIGDDIVELMMPANQYPHAVETGKDISLLAVETAFKIIGMPIFGDDDVIGVNFEIDTAEDCPDLELYNKESA